MNKETFTTAKKLQEQIDFLNIQCQTLRQAQNVLLESKQQPDDIFRFFVELMKGDYGANVLRDIVDGLIGTLNTQIQEKQKEFEAL